MTYFSEPEWAEKLMQWFLLIAAICVTVFPILYSLSTWWKSAVGRSVMVLALTYAFFIDTAFLIEVFEPDDDFYLLFRLIRLFLVMISGVYVTWVMLYYNYVKNRKEHHDIDSV